MRDYPRDFLAAIDFTLREEVGPYVATGGYISPDRAARIGDPGGETKFGISKRSYPGLDIAALTRDGVIEIYFDDYWLTNPAIANNQRSHCEALGWPLNFVHFDCCVNVGNLTIARDGTPVWHWNANRILQRALGIEDDGYVGPQTRAAIAECDPMDIAIKAIVERERFYRSRGAWANGFQAGWKIRTEHLMAAIVPKEAI